MRQLSQKYSLCVRTIWERLKGMRHVHVVSKHKDVVINMDTTYWGRQFGLMIIKYAFRNKILWHRFVRYESVSDYLDGIDWLRLNGFKIYGIVCYGMRGLFSALKTYRLQMCQYNMIQIVRRHLTTKPDLEASVELLAITHSLSRNSARHFHHGMRNGGAFFPKRASGLTVGCILHIRVQEPHTDRLSSISLTSGLLSIIRSYVSRTQMLR